jgi:hypothetical protein
MAPGRLAGGHSARERVEPGWQDTVSKVLRALA